MTAMRSSRLLSFSISMLHAERIPGKVLQHSGDVESDGHAVCALHDGQKLIYQLLFFSADGFYPFEFFAGSPELLKNRFNVFAALARETCRQFFEE